MENKKTNTLLLTVIGVATLLVAVVGATFAYFTANLTGQESATTVTVGAGTLAIAYENGSGNIETATNIAPASAGTAAITKAFTITADNSTVTNMPYELQLVIQANGFSNNALTWTLELDNSVSGANANGVNATETTIPTGITGTSTITLGNGYFVGSVANEVHAYVLKIYFTDSGANQDVDKGKSFAAYVNTTVQAAYTTTP